MRSLLNVSAMLSRAEQPAAVDPRPEMVETVTSGDAVTIRSVSGVFSRASSLSSAPKRTESTFQAGSSPRVPRAPQVAATSTGAARRMRTGPCRGRPSLLGLSAQALEQSHSCPAGCSIA